MSNIKFSGRIWKDPEMRYTKSGKPVLSWTMSLYTGKNEDGTYKKSAWVAVTAWNDLADRLQNDLKEKMTITVEGTPNEPRKYMKDGVERYAGFEVTAWRVALSDEFRNTPETEF